MNSTVTLPEDEVITGPSPSSEDEEHSSHSNTSTPADLYSPSRIAKETGLSRQHIANVLSGRASATLPTADKIAKSIGVTIEALMSHIARSVDNLPEDKKVKYAGGRKLSTERIEQVLAAKGSMTTRQAANQFGISKQTVSNIWSSSA